MTADYFLIRDLPDGRRAWVFPLTYARARIGVAERGNEMTFDDAW